MVEILSARIRTRFDQAMIRDDRPEYQEARLVSEVYKLEQKVADLELFKQAIEMPFGECYTLPTGECIGHGCMHDIQVQSILEAGNALQHKTEMLRRDDSGDLYHLCNNCGERNYISHDRIVHKPDCESAAWLALVRELGT